MTITPQQQKAVRIRIQYIWNYFLVACILLGCVQPQYFKVDYQRNNFNLSPVYASLQQDKVYAGIRLDNLLVWEDGTTKVKYIIKEGDTIQSIAKQFGTTKQSILDTNGIKDATSIKAGQSIVISYDNGVIITVKDNIPLTEFAKTYNLNIQDLISMNYFENDLVTLEKDQEIFVNLNQEEAETKGLIEKKPYESPFERFRQEEEEQKKLDAENNAGDTSLEAWETIQEVISAEETAEQIAEANTKDIPDEKLIEEQRKKEAEALEEEKKAEAIPQVGCDTNMCRFDDRCVKRPENAYCTKNDPKNAWKCKQGYYEENKQCVKAKPIAKKTEAKKEVKPEEKKKVVKKSSKAVSQWYFNPRADGAPSDWWGPGQCTSFAHRYWWKYYGIKSLWFRGNAKVRWRSAARAWWRVNKTPAIWSFGVTTYWWWGYGHVFVIIAIDGWSVQIQEMNYAGRYIVTKRWITTSSVSSFIHPIKD